jgi:hypothetical protein
MRTMHVWYKGACSFENITVTNFAGLLLHPGGFYCSRHATYTLARAFLLGIKGGGISHAFSLLGW